MPRSIPSRSLSPTLLLTLFFCLFLFTPTVLGVLRNTTIDDTKGDLNTGHKVIYRPEGAWAFGPTCFGCQAQIDKTQTFDSTWHDTTAGPSDVKSITIDFNGSAIYIFCVVPNFIFNTSTLVNVTFAIDGTDVGSYVHKPQQNSEIAYNVPVYSNSSLSDGTHRIVIQPLGGPDESYNSLLLFDYAIYSHQDNDNTSSSTSAGSVNTSMVLPRTSASSTVVYSSTPIPQASTSRSAYHGPSVGAIVGAALGSAVGTLLLIALGIMLCLRRHHRDYEVGTRDAPGAAAPQSYATLSESRESLGRLPKMVQRYLERQPFSSLRVEPSTSAGPFSLRGLEPRRRPLPMPGVAAA